MALSSTRGRRIKLVLLALLFSGNLFASTVRQVAVNNDSMTPIYLKMGKSTVLRFVEKPKKVVIGNQNYYGLEFIENDLAIQPFGAVGTNLFVYSEHHTYGFLLTPGERYDDLVFVRWKYPGGEKKSEKQSSTKTTTPNITFRVGDLKIIVRKIQGPSTFGLHIVDLLIENSAKTETSIATLDLLASRSGKALENQSIVIEKDKLKTHEKAKARIIIKLDSKTDFTIGAQIGKAAGKIIVGRKFL